MSNKSYVYPSKTLSQKRNKFDMSHMVKTSLFHGDCAPINCIEVLPGDTFKIDLASLIRMSTPIAPIMDNITMHVAAYFVPSRLVYENFEQMMGANKTGAWTADDNTYHVPMVSNFNVDPRSIGNYLGLPASLPSSTSVSALPGRAYALVWNEFYRNQNVTAPLAIDLSSNNCVLVGDKTSTPHFYALSPLKLGKYADYFTKCLPEPQKHDPVPFIAEDLQVGALNNSGSSISSLAQHTFTYPDNIADETYSNLVDQTAGGEDVIAKTLDTAWNNINSLRFAFQLQKFYEKDARYGSRYFEMLQGHYGVSNPDLVLSRPQFLGEINIRINVDQVLATANTSDSGVQTTQLGQPGANSVTANKGSLFTASFTEFGYIIIVAGARHEHTYSQQLNKLWTRSDRLEFYDPVFDNIGEQPVYKYEIYPNSDLTGVFGYQEAWADYRFIPDRASGVLNPVATGTLDFWTLTDKFNSQPLLNDSFIYENRDSIKRCLTTGNTGPDYICDFYFKTTAVRGMSLFSIPGLADHH